MLKRIIKHETEIEINVDETSGKKTISVVGQKTPYAISDCNGEFYLYDRSINGRINKVKSLMTTSVEGAIEEMWRWGHLKEETYIPQDYDIEKG